MTWSNSIVLDLLIMVITFDRYKVVATVIVRYVTM